MADKKIIIFALIFSALLVGGAWYYSKQAPGASISGAFSSASPSAVISEAGILIGNPAAPVTIEEYTNFMCLACGRFANITLSQIKEEYIKTGKVKMIIYVFPPYELSRAALCGQEQNKFMEFHDYVFAHQEQIAEKGGIRDLATNAGLDIQKYDVCYALSKYADVAAKWYKEGAARGVDATPTFFINGQKLVGAQPYGDFKKIIDEKLNQVQ